VNRKRNSRPDPFPPPLLESRARILVQVWIVVGAAALIALAVKLYEVLT
jgi:hypothetical protein